MKATHQFDSAKHAIAIDHGKRLLAVRYVPFADHVKQFHMVMRGRFSQLHHLTGVERYYDAIHSDA